MHGNKPIGPISSPSRKLPNIYPNGRTKLYMPCSAHVRVSVMEFCDFGCGILMYKLIKYNFDSNLL